MMTIYPERRLHLAHFYVYAKKTRAVKEAMRRLSSGWSRLSQAQERSSMIVRFLRSQKRITKN